ncbi:7-cyano-7-deazaguanine synthase QueC [Aneurinibacillus migulanus]|uniref:7-cyano-7-deazaguanine synthase n=1 Tax=Aneurinibacillus migulanus TaxID=47500 RepID=A0A0D1VI42_ANEMI|nr:7-cyano-7-deazaguanine synthase QueC [Aneurinibacillus migulanus]KIV59094.1 7-cyano-7-deazaguanine synthase [Aneurinibacillus migulanus]KON99194.1 7-cyano-7-deazaguanine synthase [Aneurinibacillus migulanus]MED0893389.1 7-cyano-7-deazaguanine synthase QueC [Aneurinibacillus migulanus]MED1615306.1 7-cyano-7-deazaguanine synthase QueC [Aneurinibacillus migulanus]SDI60510.1 7-cyano-7-deazaguanine synthase [Aneurinibacillus migulanus]
MEKKAVVVLSGGLDSTTCMGIAKDAGYELYPLTFHYGQRHNREVEQAKKVADFYSVPAHRLVNLDFLGQIGGSALTDTNIEVPVVQANAEDEEDIPATYVPARNMIFLSLAAAYAEVVGAEAIYIGVSTVDYSGYPDCRPEFIRSMNETVQLATKAGVKGTGIRIEAPLAHLSKKETIEWGLTLGVPYELSTSCYQGGAKACGECDSCRLRLKGFAEAGAKDPISYQKG